MQTLITRVRRVTSRLFAGRGARYWITALVVFIVASWIAPRVDQKLNLTNEKGWLFELLSQSVTNPTTPHNVKLVAIEDTGSPPDGKYLADVVHALDTADASVIALDFAAPVNSSGVGSTGAAAGSVTPGDFQAISKGEKLEGDELISAIVDVAQRRPVVLSKTISIENGQYKSVADIYQLWGLCWTLKSNGQWDNPGLPPNLKLAGDAAKNISCGYIALMDDKRELAPPISIESKSGGLLDSFPLAIVRARDGGAAARIGSGAHYLSFISQDLTNDSSTRMRASDLLRDPVAARPFLRGWPVIVGAEWHVSDGSGHLVDEHDSPVGKVVGAVVHENAVEALMSDRIFSRLNNYISFALEAVIGLVAAIVFALLPKLWMKIISIVLTMVVLLGIQWLFLQLAASFFDAYIPVLALGLHAAIDRMVEGGRTSTAHT
jgi:hypothetical protein